MQVLETECSESGEISPIGYYLFLVAKLFYNYYLYVRPSIHREI